MYKIIGADEKQYGPISADQIRQWISEGRVDARTRIAAEGSEEWKPLSAFPELAGSIAPAPVAPAKPPGAIKVFGILNIVFGGLGLLCSPFSFFAISLSSKQLGYGSFMVNWLIFSIIIGMVGGAILLASGIGLCKMKSWARKLAVYYAIFGCIMPLISLAVTLTHPMPASGPNPEFQKMGQVIGAVVGMVIAWTYNGLLIYFLTKPAVKEALGENASGV